MCLQGNIQLPRSCSTYSNAITWFLDHKLLVHYTLRKKSTRIFITSRCQENYIIASGHCFIDKIGNRLSEKITIKDIWKGYCKDFYTITNS